MRIVIISDIHDNIINLEKCLNCCAQENIDEIICCGDVANKETIKVLAQGFEKKINLVKGNAELYEEAELKQYGNIIYYGKVGRFERDNVKIGVCHEPFLIDKVLEQGDCDYIFYGHTHKPWIKERNGIKVVNPGTLIDNFGQSTFAFWDTDRGVLELKLLEKI
ncbi:MAG: metallophosphoesterase family protein [Patescibacteria group bacterium]